MASISTDVRHELEGVNLAEALDGRILCVSTDGIRWQAASSPSLTRTQRLDLYYYMAMTRAVDYEIVKLMRKGFAFGKHLMGVGNEATAVGAAYALRSDEWAMVAIRDLGVYLVRGVTPASILAQACGRLNGLTNGWDGSLHMGSREHRIAGLVSHLGTLVPVGVGCAFAERYRGSDAPVIAFIGEGTSSTGDVHEALNIASVMRLPLVLVVENNQWAFGTPTRLQYAIPTLALRALAYGRHVEARCIDGTNVSTVFDTVASAMRRARQDNTITVIEAVSMRLEGHSLADPFTTYVPARQLAYWKTKDPIVAFRDALMDGATATEEELRAIDARVAVEVRTAALEAEAGDVPPATNIEAQVFVETTFPGTRLDTPHGEGQHLTYHAAIQAALREELDRDESVFVIGEDVGISNGAFKITEGFSKRYDGIDWTDDWTTRHPVPQRRIIDAPLAEAGFCGLALGAALNGLRPVVEFQYADFASEAFKMIVNYAATQTVRNMGPVPIVFRMPSGWAPNTSIYHSVNPESWFAATPGLKIVAPVSAFDAKGLLKAAIREDNPVLFLEYKAHYRVAPARLPPELDLPVPDEDYVVPIGRARIVREGTDASIVTYGSQVFRALEAARRIQSERGASIEVIDLRTIVPFDREMIRASVRETNRALVTCEAPHTGAFGNSIVTAIVNDCFDCLDAPVTLVAAADTPVPFAPSLEAAHLPTVDKLVAALYRLLEY